MKRTRVLTITLIILSAFFFTLFSFRSGDQYTLTNTDTSLKAEQISPVSGDVMVMVTRDTDVLFTDTETGETFIIEYLTQGMTDIISLKKGHWYTVEASASVTLRPVRLKIE